MSQDYTLVTYRCGDFAIVPDNGGTLVVQPSELLDEYAGTRRSLDDLAEKPTTHHLRITYRSCHSERCRASSLDIWKVRTIADIFDTRICLYEAACHYMLMGHSYHNTDFLVRSWFADIKKCRLAQSQYGIEKRKWRDDPFFQRLIDASNLLDTVERETATLWDLETARNASQMLNNCRALVGKIVCSKEELQFGVTMIQDRERERQQQNAYQRRVKSEHRRNKEQDKVDELNALLSSEVLKQEAREIRCSPKRYQIRETPRKWNKPPGSTDLRQRVWMGSVHQMWEERMHGFQEFVDVLMEKLDKEIAERAAD